MFIFYLLTNLTENQHVYIEEMKHRNKSSFFYFFLLYKINEKF